jgi:hypothetical protein
MSALPRQGTALSLRLALGVSVAAALLWLSLARPRPSAGLERAPDDAADVGAAHAARPDAHSAQRAFLEALAQTARQEAEAAAETEPLPPTAVPHPISAEHQRLYRDVDLLDAADDAIRAQRFEEARALLAQHHRELPGMSTLEEEGLLLLTDCVEQRSPENLARVQSYYDRYSASTVRRRLRRACLELE